MRSCEGHHLVVRRKLPKRWILKRGKSSAGLATDSVVLEQGAMPIVSARPANRAHGLRRLRLRLLHERPTWTATSILLLILSGPPRLRIRDAGASLRGEIDWVVLLHVVVWALAGLWVLLQLGKRFQAKRPLLRFNGPQVLGLALIFCLSLSIRKSAAPALSAFKVYQMLVCLTFTQVFVKRFGVRISLNAMLLGNVLLCISIAICAFMAPNLVWTASDFNPDPSRLYGELIAPTGVVSVLAIILLLTVIRRPLKPLPMSLLALLFALLVLSLMRTAYIAALVFFALVFLKRPNIKPLRRFTCLLVALTAILYAYDLLPGVSHYRSPETIATLSDRIGLWRYLAAVTLNQSPWLGLGYYSASRIHGPEYNPGLGTAHSIFLEVLSGGGVLSLVMLVALTAALATSAARILILTKDRYSFAASSLFIACLLFGCLGDEIDSGPVAICFWCAAAILPGLRSSLSKRAKRNTEASDYSAAITTTGAVGT